MNFIDACIKNKRFFAAGLVGLMIIGMTAGASAQFAPLDNPELNVKKDFTDESENEDLLNLLSSYYSYYDSGDTASLSTIATPISDSEVSYIQMISQYIDSTDINEIYSKQGLNDSFMVSVCIDTNFSGQTTKAPGLDFFYVSHDADKNLYIENNYSTYNVQTSENEMDPSVTALISEFERQDDVAALQTKQQKAYETALENDPTLATLMTTTLPAVTSTWASNYQISVAQKAAEDKAAADAAAQAEAAAQQAQDAAAQDQTAQDQQAQDAAAQDQQAQDAAAQAQQAQDAAAQDQTAQAQQAQDAAAQRQAAIDSAAKVIASRKVNVRQSADENSTQLGQLDCGTEISKFSDEGDWSKIDFNGQDAYVKTQYLTTVSNGEGRDVTLTATVNIRYEMDENATKLTLAVAGDTLHVDCDYANGWSKVEINGQAAFAKTEVLN